MAGVKTIRIGALLIFAARAALGSAEPNAPPPSAMQYTCSGRQNLVIERDRVSARVTFANRSYVLQRKRSSVGEKYLSPGAALIIDGRSAVFVADDGTELGNCTETLPVASAH